MKTAANIAGFPPVSLLGTPVVSKRLNFKNPIGASVSHRLGTIARSSLIVICAACIVGTTGCQGVNQLQPALANYHARADYAGAASFLDSTATQKTYGKKSRILWELERGAVALAQNDTTTAIAHLDEAEKKSAFNYETPDGEALTKWVVNEAEASYIAQPYEDIYTNVLKQLAYLEAGKIDGYATAESLRVLYKAEHLRDVYRQYMQSAAKPTDRASTPGNSAEFVESPLGAYLAAVTFMHTGDRNNQDLASRRLVDALKRQKDYIGPVHAADFLGLGSLARDDANFLFVSLSGRAPIKDEGRLTFPIVDAILTIPYPRLRAQAGNVASVSIEIDGEPSRDLSLIEDLSSVVAENYRRAEPAIHSRTVARVAAKLGIAVGATIAVNSSERQSRHNDRALTVMTGIVGALIVQASEKADLRSWVFLPGQAHVGLVKLQPGPHRVRVVYRLSGGGIIEQPWQDITVSQGGLTTIVSHYPG